MEELPHSGDELEALYEQRFDAREMQAKQDLWQVLCKDFLQKKIGDVDTVLDLGAGSCEFINNITAKRRIAVDLSPALTTFAGAGVECFVTRADQIDGVDDASVDVVFSSNFFEHLPSKPVLLATLKEAKRVLRPGGRLIVLMPNLRYLTGRYWDYFDHHLPLTHLSLAEGLELSGFTVEESIPRFLPYTVKDARMKVRKSFVRAYLRCPPAWRIFGRQMFLVGRSAI